MVVSEISYLQLQWRFLGAEREPRVAKIRDLRVYVTSNPSSIIWDKSSDVLSSRRSWDKTCGCPDNTLRYPIRACQTLRRIKVPPSLNLHHSKSPIQVPRIRALLLHSSRRNPLVLRDRKISSARIVMTFLRPASRARQKGMATMAP